jgi:OPA family glycerol-3-phosphate transporter-like MFS transporter
MPEWLSKLAPIAILLVVVAIVIIRLPKIEGLGHSDAFLRRRVHNWLPMGLTYAFLYMGRYNIKVSQHAFGDLQFAGAPMMTNQGFATIFFFGTLTYGCSFLINGPLTDRIGGRKAILIGGTGACIANGVMAFCTWSALHDGAGAAFIRSNLIAILAATYAVNMYFQSFGAVAIVKVNAPWFHVRERGVFGAIFGVLISLGIYFAFDWNALILKNFTEPLASAAVTLSKEGNIIPQIHLVFAVPCVLLALFTTIVFFRVKDTPGEAGFADFDTADASSGDEGPQLGAMAVFKMMAKNPVIMTIALIEFCSGFLRQAIMQWFRSFAKQTDSVLHLKDSFVYDNWGMLLCCAGIMGGVIAGTLSDHVFQSRRGPVAGILYAGMVLGSVVLSFVYAGPAVGWLVVFMSACVIGVHGMLSGTASMDFGGKKNVGVAVGIIDGFVYAGTAVMAITYGWLLPDDSDKVAAADPANWQWWPVAMIPMAVIGMLLAIRVWNAKPKPKAT